MSISQNTGVAPTIDIQDEVEIQEKLVVNTSSPFFISKLLKAKCNASVPLLHATAYFLPVSSLSLFSKNSTLPSCSFCIMSSKSFKYSSLFAKYSLSQPVIYKLQYFFLSFCCRVSVFFRNCHTFNRCSILSSYCHFF